MITEKRFWDKVFINEWEPNACWTWESNKNHQGYGYYWKDGRYQRAIRLILPTNKFVLHKPEICNNPSCVRESHLYVGTQKDNVADTLKIGKHSRKGKRFCQHPNTPENTYWHPRLNGSSSECRVCRAAKRKL